MKITTFIIIAVQLHTTASFFISPVVPPLNALRKIPVLAVKGTCDNTILKECQTAFNKRLNIHADADWTNADVFVQMINDVMAQGVDTGLLKLCNARTGFFKCLGAAYDDCISRFHFLRLGFSLEQSTAYVEAFKELEFTCNGGLLQMLQNYDCIMNFRTEIEENDRNCKATFQNMTTINPELYCGNVEYYLLCSRLREYLHCSRDAGWAWCESKRIAMDIDSYCPEVSCSYALFPNNPSNKAVKSRAQLYRSPNPYFMRKEKQDLFVKLGETVTARLRRKKRSVEELEEF